jgi:predicted transcriptional regulator of viral defense system
MTTGPKRGSLSKAVLDLINGSPEGIAMAELKEKTGMKDVQIRNVLSSVIKQGKIRTVKRGVYVGA